MPRGRAVPHPVGAKRVRARVPRHLRLGRMPQSVRSPAQANTVDRGRTNHRWCDHCNGCLGCCCLPRGHSGYRPPSPRWNDPQPTVLRDPRNRVQCSHRPRRDRSHSPPPLGRDRGAHLLRTERRLDGDLHFHRGRGVRRYHPTLHHRPCRERHRRGGKRDPRTHSKRYEII